MVVGTLNASQRRYVRSILESVNAYLEQIDRFKSSRDSNLEKERGFSEGELEELAHFSHELQTRVTNMVAEFHLEGGEHGDFPSARWNIITRLEFMSVELAELSKRKLAGYGPLDDDAFGLLTERIDELQIMIGHQKKILDHR